jgi:hypothetical protein
MSILENAFGLVVGVARYQGISPLPSLVIKDARDIYHTLIDPHVCGYSPTSVRKFLDDEATSDNLRAELHRLNEQCDEQSTVFMYFSGHGARISHGNSAGEYFLPIDAAVDSDESIVRTSLSGSELSASLRRLRARKVVIFLDCCHAGGVGTPKNPILKSGLSEEFYQQLGQGRGRAIIASSRSTESSFIQEGDRNSLFTKHLLDGLQGGATSDDGLIRVFQLFEYIQPRVTAENTNQHPVLQVALEDNFPLALRLSGTKRPVPTDPDGYRYDAFISFAACESDEQLVWDVLIPRLKKSGLRVAVSGDVEEPGVFRVVGDENAIRQSKRTVIIISPHYLSDRWAVFRDALSQTMDVNEGTFRLLPVIVGGAEESRMPERLRMLTRIDLGVDGTSERGLQRLVNALTHALPTWNG